MALLFKVLFVLLLLLCCALRVPVYASNSKQTETQKKTAELFNLEQIQQEDVQDHKGEKITGGITLNEIKLPILVAAKDGVMVAITEANYTSSGEKYAVVTKYLEAKNKDKWKENNNIEEVVKMWKTRLATQSENEGKAFSTIMTSVVNAEKNKIYVFLLNSTGTDGSEKWEFKLVEGTISGDKGSEKINWETKNVPEFNFVEKIKPKLSKETLFLTLVDGSAFFTKSEKILFVVKGKSKESKGTNTEQNFIAYFQYEEKLNKLDFLRVEITAGWYSSFFEWNGEIYKTPTNGDNENVMIFNASQNNGFTEIKSSPISRLRDFLKDKNNFSTAAIKEKKSVLLFAQEKPSESSGDKKDVHLWMTDGTRVGYLGKIITGFKDISYGPVVHTNNNLFVLHHNYDSEGNTQQNKFNITLLDAQLDKINNIMTTWNENEDAIKQLYKNFATGINPCSTDGIVGFLQSTTNGGTTKEWTDKYHNGKATIHGNTATPVGNGFKFTGDNAGAKWELKQQNEHPYNFKDFGFTLLATVTVGSSNDKNSILGVGSTGNTNNVGLWCTKDGNWGVSGKNGQTDVLSPEINCTPDEKYYVALVLDQDNKIAVYVNGQKLLKNGGIDITLLQNIDYFYFGANDGTKAKTNVTITDVLLYNRQCAESKLRQLKPKEQIVADVQQTTGGDNTDPLNDDKNKTGNDSLPNTSPTINEQETAQSSSPPPTTEDSAARVSVYVLSLVFGVFTLLGRYVY